MGNYLTKVERTRIDAAYDELRDAVLDSLMEVVCNGGKPDQILKEARAAMRQLDIIIAEARTAAGRTRPATPEDFK